MAQWQATDIGNQISALLKSSDTQGPQVIMRENDVVAVVMSPDDYRRLKRQADSNFAKLLAHSPLGPEDIDTD